VPRKNKADRQQEGESFGRRPTSSDTLLKANLCFLLILTILKNEMNLAAVSTLGLAGADLRHSSLSELTTAADMV
jgi:hypothetical protein